MKNLIRVGAAVLATSALLTLAACSAGDSDSANANAGSSGDVPQEWQAARDLLPDEIAESGEITAAVSSVFAPNSFLKDGTTEFTGYEVEIFDRVVEVLGLEPEYTEAPFQQLVVGVESGRSDVAFGNLGDNDVRQPAVDFIDHLDLTFQFAVPKGNPEGVKDVWGLCGSELGSVQGTTSILEQQLSKCADKGLPKVKFVEFPDQPSKDQAIASGRLPNIDIKATPIARYLEAEGLAPDVEYLDAPDLGNLYLGIIVKKGDTELAEALQAALQVTFDDGTHQEILDKWNVGDLTIPAPGINIGAEASNFVQPKP